MGRWESLIDNNSSQSNVNPSGAENTTPTPVYEYNSVGDYISARDETYVPSPDKYNPYSEGTPQNVTDAYRQFAEVQAPTQEYADEWQNRIISDYNNYQTDDAYQGYFSKEMTGQIYNYLSDKQKTTDYTAWTAPNPDDYLFTNFLPDWTKAKEETEMYQKSLTEPVELTPEDQVVQSVYEKTTSQAQREIMDATKIEHGDWNLQNAKDKALYLAVPGSSATSYDNVPWYAKFVQNILPSAMAAGAGAMVGSLIPIPGAGLVGGAIVGGLTYIQGVTGLEIPVINKLLEGMDILSVYTEQAQGAVGAALSEAKRTASEDDSWFDLLKATGDILSDKNNRYLWDVGKFSYEASADLGFDDAFLAGRNAVAKFADKYLGTDMGQREISDISRANLGRSGVEKAVEGTQGYNALLNTYLPVYTGLVESAMQTLGYTEKQAKEFADSHFEEYMVNYMGTSGLLRDLATSSVADPMNLIPYVSAKASESIGKATGNQALQNAGKAAVGNPLIDMLDPISQPIVEGALSVFKKNKNAPDIFKTYGSQGFDIIKTTYAKNLQSMVPVDSMSRVQKQIAGVTDAGTLKGFDAITKKDGWLKNLVSTTNETRMLNLSQITTDFLGSVLFDKRIRPEQIPTLVLQAVGKMDIDDNSPLVRYRDTAVLNTIQEGWAGISENSKLIQNIQEDAGNFRKYNPNRDVVKAVAKSMNMTEAEVISALQNKTIDPDQAKGLTKKQRKQLQDAGRQEFFQKVRDAGITYTDPTTGKVLDTEAVIRNINVFNKNKRLYSIDYFKADIMDKLYNVSENYNLKKYNIQPDAWAFRVSELVKSMQSVSLLNFSSSYLVNNWLNNMITRGAIGIGGIDTQAIQNATAQRGLSFSRDTDQYKQTRRDIGDQKKVKKGVVASIDKLYKNATSDKHLLGKILKGVNNLPVEEIETKAAFQIGTSRYWDATWGSNIPAIPDAWKVAGITDDMAKQIYKMALDSPNIQIFADKLMGEVVIPGARSTLDSMIDNYYPAEAGKIMKDRFSSMGWVTDYIDRFMETGDVATINKAFDQLQDMVTSDLNLQNLIQAQGEFDQLRVRYSNEGFSAVGTAMEALGSLFADIWIDETKQNGTLFLDRVVKNIDEDTFKKMYEVQHQNTQNDYNIVRGYAIKNIGAMIEGLGLESDFSKALLTNVLKQFDLSQEFWEIEHENYQKYARSKSKDYDIKYYQTSMLDALSKHMEQQLQATKEMDALLVQYLRDNCDPTMTGHIDNYEKLLKQIEDKKEAYNKQQVKETETRMKAKNKRDRQHIAYGQEKGRSALKTEIDNLHTQAAQAFSSLDKTINSKPVNTTPLTLEQALKLELYYAESKQSVKNQGEYLQHYVDKSNPQTQFKPISFENKDVKTSFRNYADDQIRKIIANDPSVGTFLEVKTQLHDAFVNGDAVPLGATASVYSDMSITGLKIGTEFQLLDPNANVGGAEFTMARTQPFYDPDGHMVNAGVYRNGNLIGYVVSGMQESVTVDGKTYPVIGISKTDPKTYLVYINDQVWRINPESPKNYSYTIYATDNFHPGNPGSTPTTQPWGKAGLESSPALREAINLWRDQAISDLQDARTNGSFFGKLSDVQREAVFQWMDNDLRQAFSSQRFQTQRYGETMVDASLLNYQQRYGFDNMLTMLMPYQFWMTRSVANWGKRMISQPQWFSMYSRLEKMIEKNKKDVLPSRLEGLIGMAMPNMGDGLGSSLFMDIANIVFPFKQFYETGDYFIKNLGNVHQNTLREIEKMYDDGKITLEQWHEAEEAHGDLYWSVFEEQRKNDEADVSLGGLMETFLSPSVPVQAIYKHLTGHDKDISYTPAYQLGTVIKGVGDDTWFEGATDLLGNALQYPEKQLRGLLGLDSDPYGSNYTDYYINTYIANMLTDREISYNDAINAIAEGQGNKVYDEAAHRFLEQQTIRKQGGALASELGQWIGGNKETSLGQVAGSAFAGLFGAKVLPEGEQQYRKDKELYRKISASGDKEAYKQFWADHPDYKVHGYASVDDPEEKLHSILADNMSNTYYALPYSQQLAVQQGLGDRFEHYFLNKDTRALDMIPDEELIQWTRAMQGNVPQFSDAEINAPMEQAQQVKFYADSIEGDYQRYLNYIKVNFPGIDTIEDGYYNLTNKTHKKQYLKDNPSLQEYWDYKDRVRRSNPELGTFIMQRSAHYSANVYNNYDSVTEAIMNNVNDYAVEKIENYMNYGWAIPASVEAKLRTVYAALGVTNMSYDQWKKSLVKGK